MSWNDLNSKKQVSEEREPIEASLKKAFEDREIVQFLYEIVVAQSYAGMRTPDQVAFAEGQRSLARQLLLLGGKLNDF